MTALLVGWLLSIWTALAGVAVTETLYEYRPPTLDDPLAALANRDGWQVADTVPLRGGDILVYLSRSRLRLVR